MKKQLLSERQVRKMMKFANIGALSDGFIGRINEQELMDEDLLDEVGSDMVGIQNMEEDVFDEGVYEESMSSLAEQLEAELGGEEDPEADLGGLEDLGGEDPEAEEEGDDPLCSAITALKALKKGLEELDPEAASKIQLDLESEEGEEEEFDLEAGGEDEGGFDLGGGGEDEGPEGGMPPEEELEESNIYLRESRLSPARQHKRLVSDVTRRVARRLLEARRRPAPRKRVKVSPRRR